MDVTPVATKGKQLITGYGGGQFKVGGEIYTTSILIFPDRTVEWTQASDKPISLENLQVVLEEEGYIDMLLIGCNKLQMNVPQGIRTSLKAAGINLEVMDTGAACRTYNVLALEERRVAAALIIT
jgi:uncharacterized protein